jgi:hypothetical protein
MKIELLVHPLLSKIEQEEPMKIQLFGQLSFHLTQEHQR